MEALTYSGRTSAYEHKHNFEAGAPLDPSTQAGLRKVWFLDAQWSTCPVEVEDGVKDLWRTYELGNDRYILKTSVVDLLELTECGAVVDKWKGMPDGWVEEPLRVDYVVQYIRSHGIADDEQVIIHWWW